MSSSDVTKLATELHHATAVLVAIALSTAFALAQEKVAKRPTFTRVVISETASGDVKLAGDIDRDGLVDLIVGGYPKDQLSWWRWPELQRSIIATPNVEFTTDGELADLDSDGDLDIVTADGAAGSNLMWFENHTHDVTGSIGWTRHLIGAAGDWVKDIEVADFDLDGRNDVMLRTTSALLAFFSTNGDRWVSTEFKGYDLGEEGLGSADLDSDGDVDVIILGHYLANPGRLTARQASSWQLNQIGKFNRAFKVAVQDIDSDGRLDIVTSSSEHVADVVWFRRDTEGSATWTPHLIRPAVQGAHTLVVADMDRDGKIDVVVGQMHTTEAREIAVHYNVDGKGMRWERELIGQTGLHNGVASDIDGDGDIDLFGSNWAGNPPASVWLNELNPSPQP